MFKQQVVFFDPYPDQTSVNQNAWNFFPDFLKVGNLWGNHKKLSFCPISLPVLDLVSWWKYARKYKMHEIVNPFTAKRTLETSNLIHFMKKNTILLSSRHFFLIKWINFDVLKVFFLLGMGLPFYAFLLSSIFSAWLQIQHW